MEHHMIHAARIDDTDGTYWFASLDGDSWIGVSIDPRDQTERAVQRCFDGDGKFKPMRCSRSFLRHFGAQFFDR